MRSKIKNTLTITVKGQNLLEAKNIEFYVKQGKLFIETVPTVLDETTMLVTLPFEDAMKLIPNRKCELQFAFTQDNVPYASDIEIVDVKDLLKEDGYDGD